MNEDLRNSGYNTVERIIIIEIRLTTTDEVNVNHIVAKKKKMEAVSAEFYKYE